MSRWNNEDEAKNEILKLVSEYYDEFKANKKPFEPGDRINYASRVYDDKEMCNLVDSALEFWLDGTDKNDFLLGKEAVDLSADFSFSISKRQSEKLAREYHLTMPLSLMAPRKKKRKENESYHLFSYPASSMSLSMTRTRFPISGFESWAFAPSCSPFLLISSLTSEEKMTTGIPFVESWLLMSFVSLCPSIMGISISVITHLTLSLISPSSAA